MMNKEDLLAQIVTYIDNSNQSLAMIAESIAENTRIYREFAEVLMHTPDNQVYEHLHAIKAENEDALVSQLLEEMQRTLQGNESRIRVIEVDIDPDQVDPEDLINKVAEAIDKSNAENKEKYEKEVEEDEDDFPMEPPK